MNVMIRLASRSLLLAVAALMTFGCAPRQSPPTEHAPSNPASVKLYQKKPQQYQALGIIVVPVTPAMKFDDRGDSTAGFDALKAKAAALGANGVLLVIDDNTKYQSEVTAGYKGEYYQVPVTTKPRAAVAEAIWVEKE